MGNTPAFPIPRPLGKVSYFDARILHPLNQGKVFEQVAKNEGIIVSVVQVEMEVEVEVEVEVGVE